MNDTQSQLVFHWIKLPREIADLVISYLKTDKKALLACSLVGHEFSDISARHRFSDIDLPWGDKAGELERAERLLSTLLSSSRIKFAARSLSITFGRSKKPGPVVAIYVTCLQQFSNLRNLSLHGDYAGHVTWQNIVPVLMQSSILELLKRNSIDALYVDCLRGVPYELLTSCGRLSTVAAEYFSFAQPAEPLNNDERSSSNRPLRLTKLRLSEAIDRGSHHFIQWILEKKSLIHLSSLNHLTIFMPGNESHSSYTRYLTQLLSLVDGDSLQSLYIDFRRESMCFISCCCLYH